jgi:hypothetical protein
MNREPRQITVLIIFLLLSFLAAGLILLTGWLPAGYGKLAFPLGAALVLLLLFAYVAIISGMD